LTVFSAAGFAYYAVEAIFFDAGLIDGVMIAVLLLSLAVRNGSALAHKVSLALMIYYALAATAVILVTAVAPDLIGSPHRTLSPGYALWTVLAAGAIGTFALVNLTILWKSRWAFRRRRSGNSARAGGFACR
jgi:hypothetical protein